MKRVSKQLEELDFDLDDDLLNSQSCLYRSNSVRGIEKIKFHEMNFAPLIKPKNHEHICPSPMMLLNKNFGVNDSFNLYDTSSQYNSDDEQKKLKKSFEVSKSNYSSNEGLIHKLHENRKRLSVMLTNDLSKKFRSNQQLVNLDLSDNEMDTNSFKSGKMTSAKQVQLIGKQKYEKNLKFSKILERGSEENLPEIKIADYTPETINKTIKHLEELKTNYENEGYTFNLSPPSHPISPRKTILTQLESKRKSSNNEDREGLIVLNI